MKTKRNKPFLAYILALKFPMILNDTTIMVWGDTDYTKHDLPDHLLAHEEVHIKQQKNKLLGLIWWARYVFSKKFRLKQELEAYREQYKVSGDPKVLHQIATDLSGKMYGNIISFDEAVKQIKNYEKD